MRSGVASTEMLQGGPRQSEDLAYWSAVQMVVGYNSSLAGWAGMGLGRQVCDSLLQSAPSLDALQ